MNLDQVLTIKITRGQYLTVIDALLAYQRAGRKRAAEAAVLVAKGVGMQMDEDADRVITALSRQENAQRPDCHAEPVEASLRSSNRLGMMVHAYKSGDTALMNQIREDQIADAARTGKECVEALSR